MYIESNSLNRLCLVELEGLCLDNKYITVVKEMYVLSIVNKIVNMYSKNIRVNKMYVLCIKYIMFG